MRRVNRQNGTTFLIVTHSVSISSRCDRIIEVVDGQVTKASQT
jgi:lipoprotein-releasing system ATP-binding protein